MNPCDCHTTPMPPAWDGRTVLTIRQPWADWIVDGHKDVENRTWATSYRGTLWIHAAKTEDPGAWEWVHRTFGPARAKELASATPGARGAIIGRVTLVGCQDVSASLWWTGSVAWELRDAIRTTPEPKRGSLGLWIAGNAKPLKPHPRP